MRIIGIYPGQFQPPHLGHKNAYEKLKQRAGSDTFVVTTDFDPTIEAPLHFGDKEQILVRHGIPASHIKKVRDLRNPVEVLENYDPETTVVIYAFNRKAAEEKINKSSYYKSLQFAGSQLKPFKHESYILVVKEDILYKNRPYTSRSIREALGSHRFTNKEKQIFFKHFFGWFDLGLFELLKDKYTTAEQSDVFNEPEIKPPSEEPTSPENIKEELTKEIINILNELMPSPPSIATDSSFGPDSVATDKDAFDNQDVNQPTMADLVKDKQRLIDKQKTDRVQAVRDKQAYDDYKRNKKVANDNAVKDAEQAIADFNRNKSQM